MTIRHYLLGAAVMLATTGLVQAQGDNHSVKADGQALATFSDTYFDKGAVKPAFNDKLVAISATIEQYADIPGPHGKPIFKVKVAGSDTQVWVGSVPSFDTKTLAKGSEIRILGFFDKTANEQEFMAKVTQDPDYLIGFCIHEMKQGRPLYWPRWQDKCLDWENGINIQAISR